MAEKEWLNGVSHVVKGWVAIDRNWLKLDAVNPAQYGRQRYLKSTETTLNRLNYLKAKRWWTNNISADEQYPSFGQKICYQHVQEPQS